MNHKEYLTNDVTNVKNAPSVNDPVERASMKFKKAITISDIEDERQKICQFQRVHQFNVGKEGNHRLLALEFPKTIIVFEQVITRAFGGLRSAVKKLRSHRTMITSNKKLHLLSVLLTDAAAYMLLGITKLKSEAIILPNGEAAKSDYRRKKFINIPVPPVFQNQIWCVSLINEVANIEFSNTSSYNDYVDFDYNCDRKKVISRGTIIIIN
ncbi:hypothetical protein A3Q56_04883 [Intoshia linei]|uniref:Uncharacterized protein n=1 Tax=Intoshia linei TaxID=1819745 RepID=A0A177B1R6_9BILA|nr:hypothetical protein A3Q56_04883 [Intoshia linei]